MTTKKTPKPNSQSIPPFTPVFEKLPDGMSPIDMLVYGEIWRRSKWGDGKFTASALTLSKMFHVSEKTIDNSFRNLLVWKVTVLVSRKNGVASHYIPNQQHLWEVPTKKTYKRRGKMTRVNGISTRVNGISTRVNGISTRVNGAKTRVKFTHKESIGESINRVSIESPKKVDSKKKSKKEKNSSPILPPPNSISPDANNNHQQASYAQRHQQAYVPPIALEFMK